MKNPVEFENEARYIGSLSKDDQMRDFYEVLVDGNFRYVYITTDPEEETKLEG